MIRQKPQVISPASAPPFIHEPAESDEIPRYVTGQPLNQFISRTPVLLKIDDSIMYVSTDNQASA